MDSCHFAGAKRRRLERVKRQWRLIPFPSSEGVRLAEWWQGWVIAERFLSIRNDTPLTPLKRGSMSVVPFPSLEKCGCTCGGSGGSSPSGLIKRTHPWPLSRGEAALIAIDVLIIRIPILVPVKLLCLLFSVYVMLLAVKPCCINDKCLQQGRAESAQTGNTKEKECKGCSPFFSCGTCTGFIVSKHIVYTANTFADVAVRAYAVYQQPYVQEISSAIWQPPKIG
jgi:hypothetical protein